MERADYIIVGQGIAGILTAFKLIEKGRSVFLFDDEWPQNTASQVSGAVLNPVNLKNGRSAFPNDSLGIARKTYQRLEVFLKTTVLSEKPLIFFSKADAMLNPFLSDLSDSEKDFLKAYFHGGLQYRKLNPVWQVNNKLLLKKWLAHFQNAKNFRKEKFQYADCIFRKDEIIYQDISAGKIIFCEGATGKNNPFFPNLPFTKNRGNVLLLYIPGLPSDCIYHFKNRLIPMGCRQFWLGSNYQWNFNDLKPDLAWREKSLNDLKSWLKIPFQFQTHLVAERPTSAGQNVFLLQHTTFKNVFFFNGLGTKGFTLGPYFAAQLLRLLGE